VDILKVSGPTGVNGHEFDVEVMEVARYISEPAGELKPKVHINYYRENLVRSPIVQRIIL